MHWTYRNRTLMNGDEGSLADLAEVMAINARHRQGGDLAGTRADLDALARRLPGWPFPHTTRAIWELSAGNLMEARAAIAAALALSPGDPTPYQVFARILEREGQAELAEAVRAQWRRVCELCGFDPDDLKAEAPAAEEAGE